MSTAGSGSLGKRLLVTRNRIRSESDPESILKLRKREIRLLTDLGQLDEACKSCSKLLEDFAELPQAYSIMADLLCRMGHWKEAEELFETSAELHRDTGDLKSAERLRRGPLYRLAEAGRDYSRCRELAGKYDDLGSVLKVRAERQLGESTEKLPEPVDNRLAERLAQLEKAWNGRNPRGLLDTGLDWGSTEPEWRWRFIVESIELWSRSGLDTAKWKRAIRDTVCPVLDPRFNDEWRRLRI